MSAAAAAPSAFAAWDALDHGKHEDERAVVARNLSRLPLDAASAPPWSPPPPIWSSAPA